MATIAETNKYYNDAKIIYDKWYNAVFSKSGCGQQYSFPKKLDTSSANWACCQSHSSCPSDWNKYNSLIQSYNDGLNSEEYKNELANKTQESKGKTTLYVVIALVVLSAATAAFIYFNKKYKFFAK